MTVAHARVRPRHHGAVAPPALPRRRCATRSRAVRAPPQRRLAVGDFVADIPLEPEHPSDAALDGRRRGPGRARRRAGAAAVGPARPGLLRPLPRDLQRPAAARRGPPVRGRRHLVTEDAASGRCADALALDARTSWPSLAAAVPARGRPRRRRSPTGAPSALPLEATARRPAPSRWRPARPPGVVRRCSSAPVRELAAGPARQPGCAPATGWRCWCRRAPTSPRWSTPAGASAPSIVVADAGLGLRGLRPGACAAPPPTTSSASAAGWPPPGVRAACPGRGSPPAPLDAATAARSWRAGWPRPTSSQLGRGLALPAPPVADGAEAAVVFTSGATGPAKGVVYRHRQLEAQRDALVRHRTASRRRRPPRGGVRAVRRCSGRRSASPRAVPDMDVTAPGTPDRRRAGRRRRRRRRHAGLRLARPRCATSWRPRPTGSTPRGRAALGRIRTADVGRRPGAGSAAASRCARSCPRRRAHTPYGMTEALPVTDIDARAASRPPGAGDGVCVGLPVAGRAACAVSPLDADGVADGDLDRRARRDRRDLRPGGARQGPLRPAVGHRARRAPATPAGTAPATSATSTTQGRLWVEGRLAHVIVTADGVVTPVGVEQRVERLDAGASRPRPWGSDRAGTQQARRWWSRRSPAPRRGRASPVSTLADCRAGGGRGAGGRRARRPRACRSTSGTTPRSTAPGWPAGPTRVLAGAQGRRSREGAGHRRAAACSAAASPGRWPRPRRRRHACCSAAPRACGCARCSATSPTARRRRGAVAGHDAVVHLAAKVDVVGASAATSRRANVDGHPHGARRRARGRGAHAVRARLRRRRSPTPGEPLVGAGAGPADPGRARGHYARTKAVAELLALAADAPGLRRRRGPPAPGVGPGRHPAGRAASSSGPAPGRLPLVDHGAALIDTTYVDNAVDAARGRARPLPSDAHGEALVVTNGEPRPVAELLAGICRAAGVPPPRRHVPRRRWPPARGSAAERALGRGPAPRATTRR